MSQPTPTTDPLAVDLPAGATLVMLPPAADLAPFVEYVWQLTLPAGDGTGAFWRVVVDGYVDVAVRLPVGEALLQRVAAARGWAQAHRAMLDALAVSPTVVCGATTTARALPLGDPLLVTGVRFRLGAAAPVLRDSPAALIDGARPLGDVLDGRAAADVSQALVDGAAHDPDAGAAPAMLALQRLSRQRVHALARRLVARASARAAADTRVGDALRLLDRMVDGADGQSARASGRGAPPSPDERGAARIHTVARELALSTRTLDRLFAEHVGFAPRTYLRLRRVGAVARALERRAPSLSALAHDLAYTDHAHMTREFTRAMGVAPSRYRAEALASPVQQRTGAVAFERSIPVGTIGHSSAA